MLPGTHRLHRGPAERLRITPGARHNESVMVDATGYRSFVMSFLEEVCP